VIANMTHVSAGRDYVDERLLRLARDGDERAFAELAGAYRAELRAHCYRITGSLHDADDALQDALLRAWRNLPRFEGRGSVRSWLYAIATNAALDLTRHRSRRELPVAFGPSADPSADVDPPLAEQTWLTPYPDQWLTEDARLSPEARYEQRESIELAFLVVLHHLPPLQRAVLLLREVVGFSAAEVASQLGTTTQAVNSALQRARVAARSRLPASSQQSMLRELGDERTRAIVQQYADAIERGDMDAIMSMLTRDATWSMPPIPTWYRGHEAIRRFLVSNPRKNQTRHLPIRANGHLAVGRYLIDEAKGTYVPAGLELLTLDGDKIAAVTAFLVAEDSQEARALGGWFTGADLFSRFGLPDEPV
jgi:RNA polymerase sigma-70 factor (ECF subfamily)